MCPVVHCNGNLLSLAHAHLALLGIGHPVPGRPLRVRTLLSSVQFLMGVMAHALPRMDNLLRLLGLQWPLLGCSPPGLAPCYVLVTKQPLTMTYRRALIAMGSVWTGGIKELQTKTVRYTSLVLCVCEYSRW